jgi:hypothetical protein
VVPAVRRRITQTSEASVHSMGVRIHAKRPSFPILSVFDDKMIGGGGEAVNTGGLYERYLQKVRGTEESFKARFCWNNTVHAAAHTAYMMQDSAPP